MESEASADPEASLFLKMASQWEKGGDQDRLHALAR